MRYSQSKYIAQDEGFTVIIKPKDSLFLQDDYLIPQIRLKLEMLTSPFIPKFIVLVLSSSKVYIAFNRLSFLFEGSINKDLILLM